MTYIFFQCPGKYNSSPNNKLLDWSKLKAFADKKNKDEKLKFLLGWVKNKVGKGENAGYQHFLFSHTVFSKASSSRPFKVWTM